MNIQCVANLQDYTRCSRGLYSVRLLIHSLSNLKLFRQLSETLALSTPILLPCYHHDFDFLDLNLHVMSTQCRNSLTSSGRCRRTDAHRQLAARLTPSPRGHPTAGARPAPLAEATSIRHASASTRRTFCSLPLLFEGAAVLATTVVTVRHCHPRRGRLH